MSIIKWIKSRRERTPAACWHAGEAIRKKQLPFVMMAVPELPAVSSELEAMQMMLEIYQQEDVPDQSGRLKSVTEYADRFCWSTDPGFQRVFRIASSLVPPSVKRELKGMESDGMAWSAPQRLYGARTRFCYQWSLRDSWNLIIHAGEPWGWQHLYQAVPQRWFTSEDS